MNAPVTKQELDQFYGVEKTYTTRSLIIETITKTVRRAPHQVLSVPYVTHNSDTAKICGYMLADVVSDYSTDPKPLAALMAVLAGSDCPLVAKWREAMAERFADANADAVDEVLE